MKLGLKRYTSGYYSTTVHRDSKGLELIGHDVFCFVLLHFLSIKEFLVFLTTSLNATYMGSGKTLHCLLYFIRSIYFQTLSVSWKASYSLIQQRFDIRLKLTQIVIGLHKTIVLASYKCVVLEPRSVSCWMFFLFYCMCECKMLRLLCLCMGYVCCVLEKCVVCLL